MVLQKLIELMRQHIDEVVAHTGEGAMLWEQLLDLHPADSAEVLALLDRESTKKLFLALPAEHKQEVFANLSDSLKVFCLSFLTDSDRSLVLGYLPIDELTDLLDELSDDELKKYLRLLHRQDREQVLSLMQFEPESAGGLMDSNVISLMEDLTVEKSIHILQRLQPNRDLHQQIFVTNKQYELVGHILLEDLVLKRPEVKLVTILKPNELVIDVDQDRETIAQQMLHYHETIVPVINKANIFLGVIASETLVEIVEQEASEDIYRISALSPMKHTYFETPFVKLLYQRSSILLVLLILQTFSSIIIQNYQATLSGFLVYFITMLISTGGNASSQTSALVIQGIASGEIHDANVRRFVRREFVMALCIAAILGIISFLRVYYTHGNLWGSVAVSLSLAVIVMVSITLGSLMPLLLRRFDIDPAHSAGPVLATMMDIIGLLIYCFIGQMILFS